MTLNENMYEALAEKHEDDGEWYYGGQRTIVGPWSGHKSQGRRENKDRETVEYLAEQCTVVRQNNTDNNEHASRRWGRRKAKCMRKSINTLREILPVRVNSMEEQQEWEEIEMAVDSGATETVVGEDMIKGVETKAGEATRRGVQYEVASGELIPNLREKNFLAYGEQGQARAIKAQVCEVNKPLLSVSRMVQA